MEHEAAQKIWFSFCQLLVESAVLSWIKCEDDEENCFLAYLQLIMRSLQKFLQTCRVSCTFRANQCYFQSSVLTSAAGWPADGNGGSDSSFLSAASVSAIQIPAPTKAMAGPTLAHQSPWRFSVLRIRLVLKVFMNSQFGFGVWFQVPIRIYRYLTFPTKNNRGTTNATD